MTTIWKKDSEWDLGLTEEIEKLEPSTGWWYLSFADEETFRGCCFVRARDLKGAVRESIERGCNGGSDTSVWEAPCAMGSTSPHGTCGIAC